MRKSGMYKSNKWCHLLCYALPPILLSAVILWIFSLKSIYPFGEKSISWCDMDSQVVPMLCNLKDILTGKGSLLYSAQNAGGMNFLGVFYYYLSSPFHLLVVFVPKVKITQFVTLLVLFKLCAASVTAYAYFRHAHPTLSVGIALGLSVFYGCCGYAMAYYQILLWIDAVYLFPLLLLGLTKLLTGGKPYLYLLSLVAFAYICFYLTFMVAIFILLYVGVWAVTTRHAEKKRICTRFLLSSAVGVLLSLAGILPLLSAYTASARELTDLLTGITTSGVTSDINTSFPLLLPALAVFPFFFSGRANRADIPLYVTYFLTLFSVIYEPINRLWHLGSYMMFPARYAFIPCFLPLAIAGTRLADAPQGFLREIPQKTNHGRFSLPALSAKKVKFALELITVIGVLAALGGVIAFSIRQSTEHVKSYTSFVDTLVGSDSSYGAFLRYYGVILLFSACVAILYRFRLLKRVALIAVVLSLALTECAFSTRIYMAENAGTKQANEIVLELNKDLAILNNKAGQSFYRVKESRYNYLVNYTGAAGYNSLSHYTSMTDAETMRLMKRLGYESCWMEVASHTGTIFTDALFAVRYITTYGYDWKKGEGYYYLSETPFCMPLGLVTSTNLQEKKDIYAHDRVEYLRQIYAALYPQGEPLITEWKTPQPENAEIYPDESGYGYKYFMVGDNPVLRFTCTVTQKQTLYLDLYDQGVLHSTSVWPYNVGDVFVNGAAVWDGQNFPHNQHNGFLTLGTFENCTVNVEIRMNSHVYLRNLSVFGISHRAMQNMEQGVTGADLALHGNTYSGKVTAKAGDYLFVAVPYLKGFRAQVNGKRVRVSETMNGFMAIPLTEGENRVRLTFTPPGLIVGIVLSLLTLLGILLAFFLKIRYTNQRMDQLAYYGVLSLGGVTLLLLFILPPVIRFLL